MAMFTNRISSYFSSGEPTQSSAGTPEEKRNRKRSRRVLSLFPSNSRDNRRLCTKSRIARPGQRRMNVFCNGSVLMLD